VSKTAIKKAGKESNNNTSNEEVRNGVHC